MADWWALQPSGPPARDTEEDALTRMVPGACSGSLDLDGTIRCPALRSVHSVERRGGKWWSRELTTRGASVFDSRACPLLTGAGPGRQRYRHHTVSLPVRPSYDYSLSSPPGPTLTGELYRAAACIACIRVTSITDAGSRMIACLHECSGSFVFHSPVRKKNHCSSS